MRHFIFILVVLLVGCMAPYRPYDVARNCAPPYRMHTAGVVVGTPDRYSTTQVESCTQRSEGVSSVHGVYRDMYGTVHTSETEGPNGTYIRDVESHRFGGYQFSREGTTPHAEWWFSITTQ